MGLFRRKHLRPIDRLPSRFPGKGKTGRGSPPPAPAPTSAVLRPAPAPPVPLGRPSEGPPLVVADDPAIPFRGPGLPVTVLIVVLSLSLLAAIFMLWQTATEVERPRQHASAAPAQSIGAILEAARVYMLQNEPGKAEAVLESAVDRHPQDQELRVALAEALALQKKFAPAYDQYAHAIRIGPRSAALEFTAGTLASQLGNLAAASDHYASAQAQDPRNPEFPLYHAQVQLKLNRPDAAKANLLIAARLDPENATTWGSLAEVLLQENKLDLALQNIARARLLQPGVSHWKFTEAKARTRKGDPESALLLLVTLDPAEQRQRPVLSLMAQCYGLLDRPMDAANMYAAASTADPADAELAYQAAAWLVRAGEPGAAASFARKARSLGSQAAESLLAGIEGE